MTDGKSSGRAADMELVKGGRDIGNAIRGLELSERFFGEYGLPMLQEQFPQYMDVIAAGVAERAPTALALTMPSPGTMILRPASVSGSRTGWSMSWNLSCPGLMGSCRRSI